MKTWRAIGTGALLWVLIFVEVSILMFGFGLITASSTYSIIHYILLTILTVICVLIYFRKVKVSFTEGVLLGLVMLATGILLDVIITVPLFVKNWAYFLDPKLLVGYFWGFLIAVIIGSIKRK